MERAPESYQLPHHHIRARALENNDNDVFKLRFDYNFHLIKRDDGPINMRIDYTNLLPYWDEVTNSDPAVKKRSHLEKLQSVRVGSGNTDMMERSDTGVEKRWFGKFLGSLKKMNTVEAGNDDFLNMAFQKSFLLYRAVKGSVAVSLLMARRRLVPVSTLAVQSYISLREKTEKNDYDMIKDIQSQQQRPKAGLEPQFYASAQASANLAIDVSPNARIGIEVGPSVLGKGNLVNAQIVAFLNSSLDFSATVTGSVGTDTDPVYSYKYGAYLYYNLGYGGFANILGDT
ncbi:uncharacterized protein BDW70DRAFT_164334 [Aspergillus foveolatus]|uniref:uncharacterized protein n=1 Tax=Aspergillus foveolatus TaxID=210207 RepID=UPI003CCD146F